MKIKDLILFAYFLVVGVIAGCADHYALVDTSSPVANLDSPADLFPHLNFSHVERNDDGSKVFSCQDSTLTLLPLKYSTRQYEYLLDERDRIVRTELTEYSWQYRLVPRFSLSDSFKAFE
jgi:hypothetical protein